MSQVDRPEIYFIRFLRKSHGMSNSHIVVANLIMHPWLHFSAFLIPFCPSLTSVFSYHSQENVG